MDYRTKGVCSQSIHFDIEDNKIHNVSFVGGCTVICREFPIWLKEWM